MLLLKFNAFPKKQNIAFVDFEVHLPVPDPTFVKKNIAADALGLFIRNLIFLQVLQHMKCDFFSVYN